MKYIFLIITALCSSFGQTAVVEQREAYFDGTTAYLRLSTPMTIWGHSAISFRSCRGNFINILYMYISPITPHVVCFQTYFTGSLVTECT